MSTVPSPSVPSKPSRRKRSVKKPIPENVPLIPPAPPPYRFPYRSLADLVRNGCDFTAENLAGLSY